MEVHVALINAGQLRPMGEIMEAIKALRQAELRLPYAVATNGEILPDVPVHSFTNSIESIDEDGVTCLECGFRYKLLSYRHLQMHGLDMKTYKEKHGIPRAQPLCAKSISRDKREKAKEHGLGGRLAKWRERNRKVPVAKAMEPSVVDGAVKSRKKG